MNARETPDTHREVLVGVGPIHHPPTVTGGAARSEAEAAVILRQVGVFGADEMEFGSGGNSGRGPSSPWRMPPPNRWASATEQREE